MPVSTCPCRLRNLFFVLSLALGMLLANTTSAQNPSEDKPISTSAKEMEELEKAIKPYIEKARKTYPTARKKFLDGLPEKHFFYITTQLRDAEGRMEQVFILVRKIEKGIVEGVIASDIHLVSGYKNGDPYKFSEEKLLDWTIVRPDGVEEGNFVGKFLDTYQKQKSQ
jgi:hypothetical protein